MISILLTIHQQEKIISQVVNSILENMSALTKQLVFVFDGCTDQSIEYTYFTLGKNFEKMNIDFQDIRTSNVFETKANNAGLAVVDQPYVIITQDDCIIKEKDFDRKLIRGLAQYPDLFAVSGRNAHDIKILDNDTVEFPNCAGSNTEFNEPDKLYIRQTVNRGPLCLKMDIVKQLNYFDEAFCPQNMDDHDMAMRASKIGYRCGCTKIDTFSDPSWGGTRKGNNLWIYDAINKNSKIMADRYREYLKDYKSCEERILV